MHPDSTGDVRPDRGAGPGRRYATPTGEPCPRTVRVDGTVAGTGECLWCGFCLLLAGADWTAEASPCVQPDVDAGPVS